MDKPDRQPLTLYYVPCIKTAVKHTCMKSDYPLKTKSALAKLPRDRSGRCVKQGEGDPPYKAVW